MGPSGKGVPLGEPARKNEFPPPNTAPPSHTTAGRQVLKTLAGLFSIRIQFGSTRTWFPVFGSWFLGFSYISCSMRRYNNFPKGQVAIQQLSVSDLMSEASNLTISSIALCPMPFALCSQRPALCVQLSYLFIPAIHK